MRETNISAGTLKRAAKNLDATQRAVADPGGNRTVAAVSRSAGVVAARPCGHRGHTVVITRRNRNEPTFQYTFALPPIII